MTADATVTQDLTYHCGYLVAVHYIGFAITKGEILSFLGPNGAGKTTTSKMPIGQLPPKEESATMLGLDVARHREEVQGLIGVCLESQASTSRRAPSRT